MQISSVDQLVSRIPEGASVALPPSRSGVSMAATRALMKRGTANLHLIAIPTSGVQADMLIGNGQVAIVESAGITLDEFGQAPRFVEAVKKGSIKLKDSTCPALVSGLQAGEKGVPFFPMRGLIGSDLLRNRPDYRIIDNPMSEGEDPIVLLPAIIPDVALFHAPLADRFGNVWIGSMRELMTMAHVARQTLVTVEEIVEVDLMQDPLRAPATIPEMYISEIAVAKRGAWPLGLVHHYPSDKEVLADYAEAARTRDGFREFLDRAHDREFA